jgi:hypothetical protein
VTSFFAAANWKFSSIFKAKKGVISIQPQRDDTFSRFEGIAYLLNHVSEKRCHLVAKLSID